MGADLYIKSISDATQSKWKPVFDQAITERDALMEPSGSWRKEPTDPKKLRAFKAAQRRVDRAYRRMYSTAGYYRDSYNVTSVLWTLGLSWWGDVGKMLDHDGNLHPDNTKMFVEMIQRATPMFDDLKALKKHLKEHHATLDQGKNSVEEWAKSYRRERDRLVRFLRKAIHMNESVYCSV
jgi:hypothetical protein